MTRFTLLILIICSLVTGSCSGRKNKLDQKNLIPKKELVAILTDINIASGLLSLPRIHDLYSSLDSSSTYIPVIEKHGYSKETMDRTMKYYFIKNPKELIRIYDQVLGILSERESLIQKEVTLSESRKGSILSGKEYYSFPDPSGTDSCNFNLTLKKNGIYTLVFSTILYSDDQSLHPRLTAYFCNPDSLETGKRKYIKSLNYIKDGYQHVYKLNIVVPDSTALQFRGTFYDFDNNPDEWGKHLSIQNISLTYLSAAVL